MDMCDRQLNSTWTMTSGCNQPGLPDWSEHQTQSGNTVEEHLAQSLELCSTNQGGVMGLGKASFIG